MAPQKFTLPDMTCKCYTFLLFESRARAWSSAVLAAALALAQPASARPPSPSVWQARYADPLHPGCERKISIEKNGDRVIAHFAGRGPGVPRKL